MSTAEKFMAMEELWEDMSKNVSDKKLTPQWHLDILKKLDYKEKNGKLRFSSFDEAKAEFQQMV